MRLNENTKIIGQLVMLVPYEPKHVEKYHQWMKDPELQQLTASEPLTLEEEYEMQKSWREDDDKCTFLVVCRETFDKTGSEVEALVGDTNVFIFRDENGEMDAVAEAEIMIAEESARGKHYGWEAMLLMLKYVHSNLNIKKFQAKIGMENIKSLRMFEKMHFAEVSRSVVFREVTLECAATADWLKWLDEEVTLQTEVYQR